MRVHPAEQMALRTLMAIVVVSRSTGISSRTCARVAAVFGLSLAVALSSVRGYSAGTGKPDRLKQLQTAYVASANQKMPRAYHFGSQGPDDVFSNHASHTNRLVPVYVFGRKADLAAVMGENSRYRNA